MLVTLVLVVVCSPTGSSPVPSADNLLRHGHGHHHGEGGHGHHDDHHHHHSPDISSVFKKPGGQDGDNETCVIGHEGVNYEGVGAIIVFYLIVLVTGIVAGWINRNKEHTQEQVGNCAE